MKKNKIIIFIFLIFLTISLASCEYEDIANLITSNVTTEISYVEEEEEDDEEEIIIPEDTDDSNEYIIEDETKIYNKYELLAESLYQYEEDYNELYGYNMLGEDYKYGALMQDVYKTFYNDAHNFLASDEDYEIYNESEFSYIIIGKYEFTNSKYASIIASAWITFIEENPLYYFTYTGYDIETSGTGNNKTYSFLFVGGTDYAKAEDRYEANLALLDLIEDFNLEYNNLESKDDYNVALMIHDYICNKISYAYDEKGNASEEYYAHNVLGLAKYSTGVCECYAESYLLLSYLTDLNCLIVLGESGGGGHVWNYVEIDGIWYGVDATWDDGDEIIYDYFLVSSKIMNKAHDANDSSSYGIDYQVTLPTLSTTSYDTSLDKGTNTNVMPYPYYPPVMPRIRFR